MQLCIHAHGIELTEDIKQQASQKLDLALDRLEEHIDRVSVYLVDTNGPHLGGIDKACRIVVQIRQQDAIVLEDIDEKVDVVVERITDRLGVAACKRADSFPKKVSLFRRWFDGEDFPVFDVEDRKNV